MVIRIRHKIWLINGLLIIGIIMVCTEIHAVWQSGTGLPVEAQSPEAKGEKAEATDADPVAEKVRVKQKERIKAAKAYSTIAEKNLFSPDRQGPVIDPAEERRKESRPEKKSPRKLVKIDLYGVIFTDQYQAVLINNPFADDADRPYKWLKKGDTIGPPDEANRVRIEAIHEDFVVVSIQSESHELHLYKKDKDVEVSVSGKGGGEAKDSDNAENGQQQEQEVEISEDGKYKIIDTPLGKIKRRIR